MEEFVTFTMRGRSQVILLLLLTNIFVQLNHLPAARWLISPQCFFSERLALMEDTRCGIPAETEHF
jgi:hypothetical protein